VLGVLLPLVCWSWIVVMARDMYGPMTGASRWMMTAAWDGPYLFLLWLMWAVMMIGMMLPSASPILLIAGAAARRQYGAAGARHVYAMASGYVLVWAIFSGAATAVEWALARTRLVSPMMELTSANASAIVLVIAGVYQLTPLKQACLASCQAPHAFLMSRWRSGVGGAFRMGLEHGAYCVGCCWAIMLLLFVGGVMNLAVIAALTVFVAFEKLTPFGTYGARVSGVLLVILAGWMLLR
jgi:predicted metal-binding membrane protein